jgi:hypothetical protein
LGLLPATLVVVLPDTAAAFVSQREWAPPRAPERRGPLSSGAGMPGGGPKNLFAGGVFINVHPGSPARERHGTPLVAKFIINIGLALLLHIDISNMDVSRHILVLDTFILIWIGGSIKLALTSYVAHHKQK